VKCPGVRGGKDSEGGSRTIEKKAGEPEKGKSVNELSCVGDVGGGQKELLMVISRNP